MPCGKKSLQKRIHEKVFKAVKRPIPTGFICQHLEGSATCVHNEGESPFHIDFGKFKRTVDLYEKAIGLLDVEGTALVTERLKASYDLKPDPSQFKEMRRTVTPWPIDELVPIWSDLDPVAINRVKKGMINQYLYNMGINTIKKIFHQLTEVEWRPTPEGSFHRLVRCPLCPTVGDTLNIYHHIECYHTGSLSQCVDCNRLFLHHLSAGEHRSLCQPLKNIRNNHKSKFSEIIMECPTIYCEVKWVTHWRPRIMIFLKHLVEREEAIDYQSSTDESEHDTEGEDDEDGLL